MKNYNNGCNYRKILYLKSHSLWIFSLTFIVFASGCGCDGQQWLYFKSAQDRDTLTANVVAIQNEKILKLKIDLKNESENRILVGKDLVATIQSQPFDFGVSSGYFRILANDGSQNEFVMLDKNYPQYSFVLQTKKIVNQNLFKETSKEVSIRIPAVLINKNGKVENRELKLLAILDAPQVDSPVRVKNDYPTQKEVHSGDKSNLDGGQDPPMKP